MLVSSIIGFVPAILLLFILLRRYEEFFKESKIFQAFAAGMVIGMVVQCSKDVTEPSVWDITVQPACNITMIENVSVLIMNPKE